MRKLLAVILLVAATTVAWGKKTEAPPTGSCTKTIAVATATSSGVQPLAPEFVIKWWKKEAKHHPEVCFSTTAGVGTQNYLLVISSSQSYFNGLMPTTHQETDTSKSTSSVRADGTATDSQGESWNYTASGTVDTTTTTNRTVHENVPYTDNNVSLYMQLYDSHGTILRQDSHLYSTRTGGDAADSFGHNLGNALAAIHARAGLLNRMVKQVEEQQDSRAVFTPQQKPDVPLLASNPQNAELNQYCAAYPGAPSKNGVCPGEMTQAIARKWLIDGFSQEFKRNGVAGYAEIVGDNLIVHSERASATRFKMILQDPATHLRLNVIKQAGLTTWVYTNDANVNLTYDIKSSQIMTAAATPPTSVAVQEAAPDKPATPAPSATVLLPTASDKPAPITTPAVAVQEAAADKPATPAPPAPVAQPTAPDKPTPAKKKERVCVASMTFANGDEVCTHYAQDSN